MNKDEFYTRAKYFADAKRPSARRGTVLHEGDFLDVWRSSLRGELVMLGDIPWRATKQEALKVAHQFREKCRQVVADNEREGA